MYTLLRGNASRHDLLILALAVGLRLLLIAGWYTDDLSRFESGDYALYRIGAAHIAQEGDLSNSLFLVRPPLFPAIIYLLGRSDLTVLLVNAVVGALIAPLTVVLARRLGLGATGALVAGVIVAIDPAGIVYSSFLGPEPFANLLLLVVILTLLYAMGALTSRQATGWGILAAIALVLSAYARPAAYLLWIVLAMWWVAARPRYVLPVVVFALICAAGIGTWMLHNGKVFKHYTFSTIGPYTMLYYHAAAVEHLASGADMDTVYTTINRRVEERLGRDTAGVDAGRRHHYLAASPEVASALNGVAFDIFTTHPLITLMTFPIGFARMFGLVTIALQGFPLWVKALEVAWNTMFVLGTACGLWLAFRHRQWMLAWCVLLLCSYFTAGTLIVKSAGMTTRERSMLAPFMAVSVAYVAQLWLTGRSLRREAYGT
ncbi:MAG: phospholipid carrier-dependent glycosyltransferase [Aggregatilineaceae bacterium]